jgi:hypothetical protein
MIELKSVQTDDEIEGLDRPVGRTGAAAPRLMRVVATMDLDVCGLDAFRRFVVEHNRPMTREDVRETARVLREGR